MVTNSRNSEGWGFSSSVCRLSALLCARPLLVEEVMVMGYSPVLRCRVWLTLMLMFEEDVVVETWCKRVKASKKSAGQEQRNKGQTRSLVPAPSRHQMVALGATSPDYDPYRCGGRGKKPGIASGSVAASQPTPQNRLWAEGCWTPNSARLAELPGLPYLLIMLGTPEWLRSLQTRLRAIKWASWLQLPTSRRAERKEDLIFCST